MKLNKINLEDRKIIDFMRYTKKLIEYTHDGKYMFKVYDRGFKFEGYTNKKLKIGSIYLYKDNDINLFKVCEYKSRYERNYIKETNGDIDFYDTDMGYETIICEEYTKEKLLNSDEFKNYYRLKKLNRIN